VIRNSGLDNGVTLFGQSIDDHLGEKDAARACAGIDRAFRENLLVANDWGKVAINSENLDSYLETHRVSDQPIFKQGLSHLTTIANTSILPHKVRDLPVAPVPDLYDPQIEDNHEHGSSSQENPQRLMNVIYGNSSQSSVLMPHRRPSLPNKSVQSVVSKFMQSANDSDTEDMSSDMGSVNMSM